MSTIFGIYNQYQHSVTDVTAGGMLRMMNHWHADETGIFIDGYLLLGHLMLHNTPESLNEKVPFSISDYTITADARIDNREEIIKILGRGSDSSASEPDSVLILLLYIKFGRECLDHITGDFTFAIWDKKNKQLFCARDHIGIKPFYYYYKDKLFVFASEKKGILAVESVDKELNSNFIYRIIADAEPGPAETFHMHIQRLLPGHSILVTENTIELKRYWTLEAPQILYFKKKTDYFEAFREKMSEAVKCRLRTVFPVSAELSGGLDSSGVTALAAKHIDDKSNLYTFSFVLAADENGNKEVADEEIFIDEVIKYCGIINPVKVTETGRRHFLDFHETEIAVNSGVDVYSAYWQEPLRRRMEEKGIRVTLSGYLGDEAVTHQGKYYFYEFLEEGKYAEFIRVAFKRGYYNLPLKMLIRNLLPGNLRQVVNRDHKNQYKRTSYLNDPEFERMLVQEDLDFPKVQTRSYKKNIIDLVTRRYPFQRIQSESSFGIMHRLESRYPFADIRLLRFFLSLPTHIIGNPNISRYLYRTSMKGIIPDLILNRNDKSIPAAIFLGKESRQNASLIRQWIKQVPVTDTHPYLKKINFEKLLNGYDTMGPGDPQKQFFLFVGSFPIECMIKYFLENSEIDP